ncbi:hypothetical protein HBH70_097190 [Parastagonospora nodorum]|nr:hypothetical protein HBH46_105410 [Parastagonospora nodorum]KAH5074671.1 hypothetical protein HBH95_143670 [Parastagonospora nodorum]KAH5115881.1 hypothetical protein HBH71_127710 [Parastagonospora nodorum]KAH5138835.1 hypothetical protein HBH70_097190 [Parastagonospora nodorum]KAH5582712.1 hypothetical protein HBI26_122200 [Parastagonospora nodorum]
MARYPDDVVDYAIPECSQLGSKFVRHVMIALHIVYSEGGAHFYPGCHPLQVSGEGKTIPEHDLISFAESYDSEDTDVVFSIYNQLPYKVPGSAVFEC